MVLAGNQPTSHMDLSSLSCACYFAALVLIYFRLVCAAAGMSLHRPKTLPTTTFIHARASKLARLAKIAAAIDAGAAENARLAAAIQKVAASTDNRIEVKIGVSDQESAAEDVADSWSFPELAEVVATEILDGRNHMASSSFRSLDKNWRRSPWVCFRAQFKNWASTK